MLLKIGVWSVGTIRSNRLRGCDLQSEKQMKKQGRGSCDHRIDKKTGVAVVRWMDSSAVQLASTHVAVQPMSTIQRWDRLQRKYVDVSCPAIVKEYNEHMGGVDLFDMLMSLYKLDHKSCKWYRRIFLWVLNVAVVNGWLLYRRHAQQKSVPGRDQLDLLDFTASISEGLICEQKLPPVLARKCPGRPSRSHDVEDTSTGGAESGADAEQEEPENPTRKRRRIIAAKVHGRYDNVGHFPEHCEKKQRCKVCQSYVRIKCMKCQCHLCVTKDKNCFLAFHTNLV